MNYKTILACATLLTSMLFFNGRLNAAVESDVVGYSTTTIEGKGTGVSVLCQIAIQFKGLGETEDKIKLGDAISISGLEPTTWRNKSSAPCIQVYNGVGYDLYFYVTNAFVDPDKVDTTKVTGWANANQVLAEDNYLNVGDAFWFMSSSLAEGEKATLTVAGAASIAQTSKTVTIGDTALTLAANPFPTDVAIKDIVCSLEPTTWRNKSSAPCIQVYNGSGYDLYFYVTNGFVDPDKVDTTKATGWANSSQVLVGDDVKIPAGTGFWVMTTGTEVGTLTFNL